MKSPSLHPLLSALPRPSNTTHLKPPLEPPSPTLDVLDYSFFSTTAFEWFRIRANAYSQIPAEETRLRVDIASFVTAYGRSGLPSQKSHSPPAHRLINLEPHAVQDIMAEIESHFLEPSIGRQWKLSSLWSSSEAMLSTHSLGVDWRAKADHMTQRYARRIANLHDSLHQALMSPSPSPSSNPLFDPIVNSRMIIANLIYPHYSLALENSLDVAVEQCTTFSTSEFHTFLSRSPTLSEQKMLLAIQHVQRAICRTLILMYIELQPDDHPPYEENGHSQSSFEGVQPEQTYSKGGVRRALWLVTDLMEHLRWSAWKSCDKKCGVDEVCSTSNSMRTGDASSDGQYKFWISRG
ncbi:hypothetical protein DL93DRAFT_1982204 [Clavulina sp. PMI_390]|nr:hypothetical protein DL93DRAFT_1982204 [Clavulina sp. PMI_390]